MKYVAMESLSGYMPHFTAEAETAAEAWIILRDNLIEDIDLAEMDDHEASQFDDVLAEMESYAEDGDLGTVYAPAINEVLGEAGRFLDIAYSVDINMDEGE